MEASTQGSTTRHTVGVTRAAQLARRHPGAFAAGIVVLVGAWLARPFWLPGGYVVGFDTFAYSGPNSVITDRAVRSGRLPLLNDSIFAGVPHLGNPQTGTLYLPRLLTLALETNRAMGVLVAIHLILLGVGMLVFARRLAVGHLGAVTSAVVAMASGAVLTKTVQFEQILVLAWAPLLLVTIHVVLTTDRPTPAVAGLAAVTAATLLAGHPQLVYQNVVLAVVATVGFAATARAWRRLGHVTGGVVLGAAMAAPHLIAALFSTADSALSADGSGDRVASRALSIGPSLLARVFLGSVQDRDPASFAGGFENIAAVGVVVVILAAIGWTAAVGDERHRGWSLTLSVAALLGLVWSFGTYSWLFRWAWDWLPGFDLARATARWIVIPTLVIALLAGLGLQTLADRARRRHLVVAVAAVAVVALGLGFGLVQTADRRSAAIWAVIAIAVVALLAAMVLWPAEWTRPNLGADDDGSNDPATSERSEATTRSLARRRVPAVALSALVVLGAAEVTVLSLRSVPVRLRTDTAFTEHQTPTSQFLAGTTGFTIALTDDGAGPEYEVPGLRPNANVLSDVRSIDGYDGGVQITERWATALRRLNPEPFPDLPLRNSLSLPVDPLSLARLGVRYVLLDRDRPAEVFVPDWRGPVASDEWFEVWENPWWRGEALAWSASIVGDPSEAADLLRTQADRFTDTVLVDAAGSALDCPDPEACGAQPLELERRSAEHLVVRVDREHPSVVMVHRQALPGWVVRVDGVAADPVVVDGLFLGVEVPAGEHEVVWRYRPGWIAPSFALMVVAALVTAALGGLGAARARRDRDQVATEIVR